MTGEVFENKLDTIQLIGIALSWWEAYSGAVDNANTITWE